MRWHDHMHFHGLTVGNHSLDHGQPTSLTSMLHNNSFQQANHWNTNIVKQCSLIGQQSTANSTNTDNNQFTVRDMAILLVHLCWQKPFCECGMKEEATIELV